MLFLLLLLQLLPEELILKGLTFSIMGKETNSELSLLLLFEAARLCGDFTAFLKSTHFRHILE